MVYKRPLVDEESYELACKHPRQLEYSNQLASFVDIVPYNDMLQKPQSSVGEGDLSKSECKERLNGTITELSAGVNEDFETTVPVSASSLSWVTSSTSEEDSRSEAVVRVSFSPDFSEPDFQARVLLHSEEVYSSFLDYPPRRLVSVGPDHQAAIPAWGLQDNYCLGEPTVEDDSDEKLMGNCVIPMPDFEQSVCSSNDFGYGRIDCSCPDRGSIRCVRQHVMEAREKLRETLGQEKFVELGFCDMGEEVASKWTEEDEQLFREVVFSNPASLGKNFWDNLSMVFPYRTKKEIISYYFNVFMLRRRAEQNRVDPMNIDSDNDEWQGSYYDGDEELGITEEDEDSVVESPVGQDVLGYDQEIHDEDFHEDEDEDDEDEDEISEHNDSDLEADRNCIGEGNEVSEACMGKSLDCGFAIAAKLVEKNPQDGVEDHDVQDESCTSYECQTNSSSGLVDAGSVLQENKVEIGTSSGGIGGVENGYVMEPCDARVWDVGYLTGPKKDVEFLSTCTMIEEVFGEEA